MSVPTVSDIVITKNVTVPMGCLQTSDTIRSQLDWQASLACLYLIRIEQEISSQVSDVRKNAYVMGESRTILLPGSFFEWQPVLVFGVAFFAARHKIAFGGFTASNDRYEMIHGQNCRRESAAAMVAEAEGSLALPPLAGTQLSSLSALAADFFFTDRDKKRSRFHADENGYLYQRLIFMK